MSLYRHSGSPRSAAADVVAVPAISLPAELAMAGLGGIVAGLGTFVGALTQTSASDTHALQAAGIGAGFTALTFFTNSLRGWFQQRYGIPA